MSSQVWRLDVFSQVCRLKCVASRPIRFQEIEKTLETARLRKQPVKIERRYCDSMSRQLQVPFLQAPPVNLLRQGGIAV